MTWNETSRWDVDKGNIMDDILEAKKRIDTYGDKKTIIRIPKSLWESAEKIKYEPSLLEMEHLSYLFSGEAPRSFISRDKRPRKVVTVERHTTAMPRWYWRLLCDLQDIRDLLHFAWWVEKREIKSITINLGEIE